METTYDPSARLDSGMTLWRVWGSVMIPALDFSGLMGGRDMGRAVVTLCHVTII